MGSLLFGLIKLQSVENQLRTAKAKLGRCRRSVIIQENQLRSLQNSIEAKKEEIQLTRIQSDRLELELKVRDESVAKYRAALNTARTNKEYAAILTELNTSKADNSKLENQVLELMKNIETDESECEQINNEIAQQKEKLNELRKEVEVQAKKYEAEIEQIQKQWDEAAGDIPPETLEIFNRVAETYDGEAIATVGLEDVKSGSYICGGCFMGLTNETANMLMIKDEVIRCPNCVRILVMGSEE
jgi:uncharacterized protein